MWEEGGAEGVEEGGEEGGAEGEEGEVGVEESVGG